MQPLSDVLSAGLPTKTMLSSTVELAALDITSSNTALLISTAVSPDEGKPEDYYPTYSNLLGISSKSLKY